MSDAIDIERLRLEHYAGRLSTHDAIDNLLMIVTLQHRAILALQHYIERALRLPEDTHIQWDYKEPA